MHTNFILSDIFDIIEEGFNSVATIPEDLTSYPIVEYILPTIFLKVTGYQEQKIKCILWQLATHDFDFRYKYLKGEFNLGEGSNWSDKNLVFGKLKEQIKKHCLSDGVTEDEAREVFNNAKDRFLNIVEGSKFKIWLPRDYERFLGFIRKFGDFPNGYLHKGLLGDHKSLRSCFDHAIDHRNNCAHNIVVFQNNVPSLSMIKDDTESFENYFSRLFVIALIDKSLSSQYSHYIKNLQNIP